MKNPGESVAMVSASVDDASRKTLVYVCPALFSGGASNQTRLLLLGLRELGWAISVVTLNGMGPVYDRLLADGFECQFLSIRDRNPLKTFMRFMAVLRDRRPLAVVGHGFNASVAVAAGGWLAGVPNRVIVEHSNRFAPHWGLVHSLAYRLVSRLATRIVTVSGSQMHFAINSLGAPESRLVLIANGVDVDAHSPALRERGRRVLAAPDGVPLVGTVTRLEEVKDVPTFLRAAALVLREIPDAVFVIVGGGPERERLVELARALGIADNVMFTGPRDDVRVVMSALDVFTLCSVSEAMPLALLEAMASGVACVCTDAGDMGSVLQGGAGRVVAVSSPAELASQWLLLLSDPELRIGLGVAARAKAVTEYSAQRMAREYDSILASESRA